LDEEGMVVRVQASVHSSPLSCQKRRTFTGSAVRAALAVAVLLIAAPRAEASNNRSSCLSNLHNLYFALQIYHEQHGSLPTDICDAQGRPLLSWRVRLLPYID